MRVKLLFSVALIGLFAMIAGVSEAQNPVPFQAGDSLDEIQQKIELNNYTFEVKPNHVFLLSPEDREQMMGRRMRPDSAEMKAKSLSQPYIRLPKRDLPSAYDSRNVGGNSYINPIRDQGSAGTCFSFAAVSAAEASYNITSGLYGLNRIQFSESYIAWSLSTISPYSEHFGDGGADYDYYELLALTSPGASTGKEGAVGLSLFPYQYSHITDDLISGSWSFPRTLFDSWSRVYPADYADTTDQIKAAILQYGAVDAAVNTTSAFDAYSSGVYEDSQTTADGTPYYYSTSDHAISLVGWDDNPPEGGGGVWILRNSWGTDWGESGYMRIRYESAHVNTSAALLVYQNQLPIAHTGDAGSIGDTSAALSGTVNPLGDDTSFYFEYGTTQDYGQQTAVQDAGSGSSEVPVVAALLGLQPQTTYYVRLVATNSYGSRVAESETFVTTGTTTPPSVDSGAVSELTSDSATISGIINPHGEDTGYRIDYGTSLAYGSSVYGSNTLSGTTATQVELTIPGLLANTTYHYRLVAYNDKGPTYGIEVPFTTPYTVLTEGFDVVPPTGWTQEVITVVGSTNPVFASATHAAYQSIDTKGSGNQVASFNSYHTQSGSEARLESIATDMRELKNSKASFSIYHDSNYSNHDYLQIQVYDDVAGWLNVGSQCERYNVEQGWAECEADLSHYDGQNGVVLGIKGHSDWGKNIYADNFRVYGERAWYLEGTVSGDVSSGVTLEMDGDTSGSIPSDSDGTYYFGSLSPGTFTITPQLQGYVFNPASRTVVISGGGDSVSGVDFVASVLAATPTPIPTVTPTNTPTVTPTPTPAPEVQRPGDPATVGKTGKMVINLKPVVYGGSAATGEILLSPGDSYRYKLTLQKLYRAGYKTNASYTVRSPRISLKGLSKGTYRVAYKVLVYRNHRHIASTKMSRWVRFVVR